MSHLKEILYVNLCGSETRIKSSGLKVTDTRNVTVNVQREETLNINNVVHRLIRKMPKSFLIFHKPQV
jgi:hypothetical protein